MITEKDLQEAIAECQGQRNPNANTCIKLAAFYTIKRAMFGEEKEAEHYSFAPAPYQSTIEINSDSEFARAIDGRDQKDVWKVLDEMMDTIQMIHPRLYDAVMTRLRD